MWRIKNRNKKQPNEKAAHGGMNRPFDGWKRKKLWRYNKALEPTGSETHLYMPRCGMSSFFFKCGEKRSFADDGTLG